MTPKPTLDSLKPHLSPPDAPFERPSVPLSVYRELVKELQTTQERIDSLEVQNDRIVQENRHLRQEIDKVVEHSKNLERVVQTLDETRDNASAHSFVIPVRSRLVTPPSRQTHILETQPTAPMPKARFAITPGLLKSEFDPKGWMMTVTILVVVLTSGLGAFWLVSAARR